MIRGAGEKEKCAAQGNRKESTKTGTRDAEHDGAKKESGKFTVWNTVNVLETRGGRRDASNYSRQRSI
jgi:hypothetical protein